MMAGPTFKAPDLQSNAHRDLLDVIDHLRTIGVNHYVPLPQIVVCGDQTSGKSSVLEAISGQSFPTKVGMCTRFPTELVLRRGENQMMVVTIRPDEHREDAEKRRLAAWNGNSVGHGSPFDLTKVVLEAHKMLGLREVPGASTTEKTKAIVKDVLRVEITGPNLPHLTLVDLPGLFSTPSSWQDPEDIKTARNIAMGYMSQPRTAILAVVSANIDYNNQTAITHAREADPGKARTMALITKPDMVEGGPNNAWKWIHCAKNKDEKYDLGWHVLRNPSAEERRAGKPCRDDIEKDFFSQGPWATLDPHNRGIVSLRTRLSQISKDQLVSELPGVLEDVEKEILIAKSSLAELGECRDSPADQIRYLSKIQAGFGKLIKEGAIDGNYNDSFFAKSESGDRNLYARYIELHEKFMTDVKTKGHALQIVNKAGKNKPGMPQEMSREEYSQTIVLPELKKHRGRELPGMYNPTTIATLYRRQNAPWGEIIEAHVESVVKMSYGIAESMIRHLTDKTTANAIIGYLGTRQTILKEKVQKKMREVISLTRTGPLRPIAVDLSQELEEGRRQAEEQLLRDALITLKGRINGNRVDATIEEIVTAVNFLKCSLTLDDTGSSNMDKYASLQATYVMEAYYKVEKARMIEEISSSVLAETLIHKLDTLFDQDCVLDLDSETIRKLAGESVASVRKRAELTEKIYVLEKGLKALRQFYLPDQSEADGVQFSSPSIEAGALFAGLSIEDINEVANKPSHHTANNKLGKKPGTPKKGKHRKSKYETTIESGSEDEHQPPTPAADHNVLPEVVTTSPSPPNGYRQSLSSNSPKQNMVYEKISFPGRTVEPQQAGI